MKCAHCVSLLALAVIASNPAGAQQINGTPGSPSATITIDGKQLPAPPQKFEGKIEPSIKGSKPYWPARVVPPKGAPSVLLIITDDAGYGVSSTFGGVIPTPALDRIAHGELRRLVRSAVDEVKVEDEQIVLQLDRQGILSSLLGDAPPLKSNNGANADPVVLTIEASLRRAGKGLRLMIGDGTAQVIDAGLVKLIGRAVAIRNELLSGKDESIDAMARRLGAKRDHLTVLVRLSYLAPDLVRAILDGRHPVTLSATRLQALSKDLPHSWKDQRQYLGFAAE